MKKAKIVASIVLAAALSTTMFAAACGKKEEEEPPVVDTGKEFVVSEYAHALDSALVKEVFGDYGKGKGVHGAYSTFTKLDYDDVDAFEDSNFAIVDKVTENDDAPDTHSYSIYDLKTGKVVLSGYDNIQRKPVDGVYHDFSCFALGKLVDDKIEFELMGPDGKVLTGVKLSLQELLSLEINNINSYTDEDDTELDFFKLTYTKYDDEGEEVDEVEAFLCYAVDEDGVATFKVVKEADTETPEEESDYPAGSVLGLEKKSLTSGYDEFFPGSNWEGIEYTVEGLYSKTYTFYKNDSRISTVELSNATVVGFVGNYLYYYDVSAVSSEATEGYNYEYVVNGAVVKANYTLYRFDVAKGGEVEEVETDYIVTIDSHHTASPLYNYTTKTFDKLAVTALKKVNGVATDGKNNREYVLVLDDEFKVSADLSAKNVNGAFLVKLKDGRYLDLMSSLIVDDELNTVAEIPYNFDVNDIWAEKGLLVCEYKTVNSSNYYSTKKVTMFVDFDGKVVIEPSSLDCGSYYSDDYPDGTLEFYGDVAYNSTTRKLYSAANPSGVAVDKLIKVDEEKNEEAGVAYGLIVKYTPVENEVGEGDDVHTVDTLSMSFYDLSGKLLGTIANVAVHPYGYPLIDEPVVVCGKVVIGATVYTDLEEEPVTVYWVIG